MTHGGGLTLHRRPRVSCLYVLGRHTTIVSIQEIWLASQSSLAEKTIYIAGCETQDLRHGTCKYTARCNGYIPGLLRDSRLERPALLILELRIYPANLAHGSVSRLRDMNDEASWALALASRRFAMHFVCHVPIRFNSPKVMVILESVIC